MRRLRVWAFLVCDTITGNKGQSRLMTLASDAMRRHEEVPASQPRATLSSSS